MPLEDLGAGGLGVPGQFLIEAQAGADQAVLRKVGDLRPGQLDGASARDQPKALVPAPAILFRVRQAELLDLPDGARGEAVAADFLAREAGFLQDRDINTGPGQVIRGRGAGRPRADDQYINRVSA